MPKKRDPFPGVPQEQKIAGLSAAVAVGASLLQPVIAIPPNVQQDIILVCTTYGSTIVGAGTLLRWRRLGNQDVVKKVTEQADDDRLDWLELPTRYGGLILGAAALLVGLAALILILT